MLDFTVMTDDMLATIDRVNAIMLRTREISQEIGGIGSEQWGLRHVDQRDFNPMALLLEVPDEGTPEEREAARDEQIRAMERAFFENDENAKKQYLDLMYDFRDHFDPEALDMTNEKDRIRLLAYVALGQTYGTKGPKENSEYYQARYNTLDKLTEAEAIDRYNTAIGTCLMNTMKPTGKILYTELTLPGGMPGKEVYSEILYDVSKADMERIRAKNAGREPEEETAIHLPMEFKLFNHVMDNPQNTKWPDYTLTEAFHIHTLAFNGIYQAGTRQVRLMDDAKLDSCDMIFIDGKSLRELQQEKFPNISPNDRADVRNLILMDALVSGKNRVELAQLEEQRDHTFQVKLTTLHPDLTNVQPPLKEDYGFFRRTFFNWGPFRCKTRQEKTDALLANDPNKAERLAEISAKVTEKIEPALARRRENTAQAAREAARERVALKEIADPSKEDSLTKTKVQDNTVSKQKNIEKN